MYRGNDEKNDNDDYLTSIGCGVTVKFDERNSAKIVAGIPLQHTTKYTPRIHFVWQSLL